MSEPLTYAGAHRRLIAAGVPLAARREIVASAHVPNYRLMAAIVAGDAEAIGSSVGSSTGYDAAVIDAACAQVAA